jgi:calcineurin-like phosphoesterase family protein
MNDEIVRRWNEVVAPDDDVYHLGDVMLNDNDLGLKLLKSLKGNIHIVLGNHDTEKRIKLYEIS